MVCALGLVTLASACVSSCGGGGGGSTTTSVAPASLAWFNPVGTTSSPLVLYTDLAAGPTSGGENNGGAYLSIFGRNFGSNLANIQVTIGGHPVAKEYYLGSSLGRPDIQQISVQVGALGGATQGQPLPVVVSVNGTASNSDLTFTPNPGQICYVSNASGTTPLGTSFPAGNDTTGKCGDINHPFATVQDASEYTGGAWPNTQAGDTIVLLPTGTAYQEPGFQGYFMRFYRGPGSNGGGTAPTGASGTGYMTLMGYPGPTVPSIYSPTSINSNGAVSASDSGGHSYYMVVADLQIEGDGGDGAINTQILSDYARIINNRLTAPSAKSTARSGCIAGDGNYMKILGNTCRAVNSPDTGLENHGVYLDAAGNDEIAYNFIYDINDGSGIQLYNSQGVTPTIDNVVIHHNWIFNVAKHGINIADTSGTGIIIFDNVVANASVSGIRFNSTDLKNCLVFNNTIYNTDLLGNSSYGSVMNDGNLPSGALNFQNNIFVTLNGSGYFGGSVGFSTNDSAFSHDLYYGGSLIANAKAATLDSNATFADPQFTSPLAGPSGAPSPSNQTSTPISAAFSATAFTLSAGSPALGAGSDSVGPLVLSDFALGPAAAPYFIGALH